jgi:hypothetical protein
MKKILTLLFASLFSILSLNSNAKDLNLIHNEYSIKPPEVHINFIVAKPRTQCETFPGICRVELGASFPRYSGVNVGGIATYENGTLKLEFSKKEMDAAMIKRFSEITIFPIEDPYVIPANVCESLVAPSLTIPIGRYPIIRTLNGFSITIICR